ncbi:MAG: hypothetical protein JXB32_16270 [Deltaproteobacteria bacterium]|nr:hypothetical protein [Deltaproteobacteria bacterium]
MRITSQRRRSRLETPECEVLGQLYESAACGQGWDDTVRQLAAHWGAQTSWIAALDVQRREFALSAFTSPSPELLPVAMRFCSDASANPVMAVALRSPVGLIGTFEYTMPREELVRTRLFEEAIRPFDAEEMMAVTLLNGEGLFVTCSVYRSRRIGAFTEDEKKRLGFDFAHMRRAVRIHLRLQEARRRAAALTEVLDHVTIGVILLDREGRLVVANRTARGMLDVRDGLRARNRRLWADHAVDGVLLRQRIDSATLAVDGRCSVAGGELAVRRPSGRRPYELVVAPLTMVPLAWSVGAARVLVLVQDPEAVVEPSARMLRRQYGLTPAEANVCVALAGGADLRGFAEAHGVSLGTVRTHLYRAMDKTGTRRQVELVRLLVAGV